MGVYPSVLPILLSCTFRITKLHYTCGCSTLIKAYVCISTYRITGLHYTYGCATFSGAYVDLLYVPHNWVTLNL